MNFTDSYSVAVRNQLFQNELNWLFLKTGIRPSDALFISYAYKGENYASYFQKVYDVFINSGIRLIDIQSV